MKINFTKAERIYLIKKISKQITKWEQTGYVPRSAYISDLVLVEKLKCNSFTQEELTTEDFTTLLQFSKWFAEDKQTKIASNIIEKTKKYLIESMRLDEIRAEQKQIDEQIEKINEMADEDEQVSVSYSADENDNKVVTIFVGEENKYTGTFIHTYLSTLYNSVKENYEHALQRDLMEAMQEEAYLRERDGMSEQEMYSARLDDEMYLHHLSRME